MPDWNERYRKGEHAGDEPHPLVARVAGALHPGRALDVACGTGRHARWLAERGWQVTAVDNSCVAIGMLQERARAGALTIDAHTADLETGDFRIAPASYDLIVVVNYLQRDLFPAIRSGVSAGGVVLAVISMVDDAPGVKPMNPAYLLRPGELSAEFPGWEIIHTFEGKPAGGPTRRAVAEIAARRRW